MPVVSRLPRRQRLSVLLATAAVILVPGPAEAQQSPLPAAQLPEITVFGASNVPLEAPRVGSAVTVITAEDIANQGAASVPDVLCLVPGVAVNQSGGRGSLTQTRVRGAESNQVLVVVDGIPINDVNSGDADLANLPVDSIARIEVIRGPQSGIWGPNAQAGVISITTKSGRGLAKPELTARIEGGSLARSRARRACAARRVPSTPPSPFRACAPAASSSPPAPRVPTVRTWARSPPRSARSSPTGSTSRASSGWSAAAASTIPATPPSVPASSPIRTTASSPPASGATPPTTSRAVSPPPRSCSTGPGRIASPPTPRSSRPMPATAMSRPSASSRARASGRAPSATGRSTARPIRSRRPACSAPATPSSAAPTSPASISATTMRAMASSGPSSTTPMRAPAARASARACSASISSACRPACRSPARSARTGTPPSAMR